jgi:Ca2+-transporting ATPase
MAVMSLLIFSISLKQVDLIQAQTMVFLFIVLFKLFLAFSSMSTIYPVIDVGVFKNIWLNIAVALSFIVVVSVTYIPALNVLFNTAPLAWYQFLMIFVLSSAGAVYLELYKYYKIRNELKTTN